MSIFVEDSDNVEISVHYVEENGKVIVHEEPVVGAKTIKMVFRRPDFSMSQRIMATSTVTDQNGNQTINLMMLQNNLMYYLAKSWDIKTPDSKDAEGKVIPGKPVEFNSENIGKLKIEIARAVVNKLVENIGQIM